MRFNERLEKASRCSLRSFEAAITLVSFAKVIFTVYVNNLAVYPLNALLIDELKFESFGYVSVYLQLAVFFLLQERQIIRVVCLLL